MKRVVLLLLILLLVPFTLAKGSRGGGKCHVKYYTIHVHAKSKHPRSPKPHGCSPWTLRTKCHTH